VVIAIIALLISLLLPALGEARRTARLAICHSNLKQMGVATQSYSADYQDRLFAFSWQPNSTNGLSATDPDATGLLNPTEAVQAAAYQAVYIFRKRGDRANFAIIPNWIPHVLYTHLVLQDYLAQRIPEKMVVCPEDQARLTWHDWRSFDQGLFEPLQPLHTDPNNRRWPYSSSYQPPPAMWDRSIRGARVSQTGVPGYNYFAFYPGATKLGNRKIADVTQPSNKVAMMDEFDRHFHKKKPYYIVTNARNTLLTFDGAVSIRYTRDCNKGADPNTNGPLQITYLNSTHPAGPRLWDPEPLNGPSGDLGYTYYRFTRGGLRGIDFGGGEINTTGY
jgi:hypothetical protein